MDDLLIFDFMVFNVFEVVFKIVEVLLLLFIGFVVMNFFFVWGFCEQVSVWLYVKYGLFVVVLDCYFQDKYVYEFVFFYVM